MKLSDRIEQMVNPVHGLPQEIDNLLEHLFGQKTKPGDPVKKTFCPRADILEREKEFVVQMELPGVSVSDVSVETADDQLVISGEKTISIDEETEELKRRERATGEFKRVFEFPIQVDFDLIKADYKLGVLTVTLPKSEKVMPRKIEINVTE